jgi:hypothetical protein
MTDAINIKKRLAIIRGLDTLIIDEGDNFEASFDYEEIGGNLTFDLPYTDEGAKQNKSNLTIQNLQKFDYVFLYYAEVDSDREPYNSEWKTIFAGYIEKVKLQKSKDNISYRIDCSSLIALSNYAHVSQGISFADGDTQSVREVPYLILQKINLQSGPYNYFRISGEDRSKERDVIPSNWLFVDVDQVLTRFNNSITNNVVFNGTLDSKNGKEAIEEFKNKFGLIFHQNMDGTVQVTSLTNYIANKEQSEQIAFDSNDLGNYSIEQRANLYSIATSDKYTQEQKEKQLDAFINRTAPKVLKVIDWIGNTTIRGIRTISGTNPDSRISRQSPSSAIGKLFNVIVSQRTDIDVRNPVNTFGKFYNKVLSSEQAKNYSKYGIDSTFTIPNVLEFDITKNIFDLEYPDFTTVYDAVVVYGTGRYQVGKAIDLASIALKEIPEVNGKYNVSTYIMYKDDINNQEELDEIARNKLYELKQDNKVTFKTSFIPVELARVGMPFILKDYDKYQGDELFFITRISYTLSKSDVYMEIEGRTSILNLLPEDLVTSNNILLDVDMYNEPNLRDKIQGGSWQNF